MKNGVVMSSSYHVDETNKVVVCTLYCNVQFGKHEAYFHIIEDMYKKKLPYIKWGSFEVKAKARCNASDTFNVETGKRIAESRAKAKAFRTAKKLWNEIAKSLKKAAKSCENTAIACNIALNNEVEHVIELCTQ